MKLTALVSSWSKINPVAKVHGQRLVGATVASVFAGPSRDVELILAVNEGSAGMRYQTIRLGNEVLFKMVELYRLNGGKII